VVMQAILIISAIFDALTALHLFGCSAALDMDPLVPNL